MKKLCYLTIWVFFVACQWTYAQNLTVTGRVTDQGDNSPLPGVSVLLKGTTTGTVSDAEGNYSIAVPDNNATLVYSMVGMTTQEQVVNGRSQLNVQLVSDARSLSEVVVVGYGTQRKIDVTGAVAQV